MGMDLYNHFGIHLFQDLVLERGQDIRRECRNSEFRNAGIKGVCRNERIMVSGIRFVIE